VLYGCENWSLTLREEHGLRVFENRVLRKIFGPKREEDGRYRKLHDDELYRMLLGRLNQGGFSGRDMWHAWERCLKGFGWEARREETTGKT